MDNVLKDINPVLQILVVMTVFSLIPLVFCCMTSFLRFVIVFSMLKTALGTQSVPPAIVIIGLSVILTFFTMGSTFQKMYDMGSVPYQRNQNMIAAIEEGSKPLKEFMMKQTRQGDLAFFIELSHKAPPKTPDEITVWQVAPAYIMSELKTAFEIGFVIFVPFIVLDLVVANILLALGMFMLSPTIISLPFKLLIFIAVDGWALIVQRKVKFMVEILAEYLAKGFLTMLTISMPCVLCAAGIGLVVGILQAVTQVQEQTIAAAPKILGVFLVIVIGGFGFIRILNNLFIEGMGLAFNVVPKNDTYVLAADYHQYTSAYGQLAPQKFNGRTDIDYIMKNPNRVPYIDNQEKIKTIRSNRVDNPMPDLLEGRTINRRR